MGIRERKRISIPGRVGRGEKRGTARGLVSQSPQETTLVAGQSKALLQNKTPPGDHYQHLIPCLLYDILHQPCGAHHGFSVNAWSWAQGPGGRAEAAQRLGHRDTEPYLTLG